MDGKCKVLCATLPHPFLCMCSVITSGSGKQLTFFLATHIELKQVHKRAASHLVAIVIINIVEDGKSSSTKIPPLEDESVLAPNKVSFPTKPDNLVNKCSVSIVLKLEFI